MDPKRGIDFSPFMTTCSGVCLLIKFKLTDLTKFDIKIIPLEATPSLFFLISCHLPGLNDTIITYFSADYCTEIDS